MPPAFPRVRALRICVGQRRKESKQPFGQVLWRTLGRFALAGLALDIAAGVGLLFVLQKNLHAQPSAPHFPRTQSRAARATVKRPMAVALRASLIPVDPDANLSPSALMERWQPLIKKAARRFAVPEAWIREVMREESGGRTMLNGQPIVSRAGAMGLMQLLPATYRDMSARYRLGADILNPRDNILAGAAYLRELNRQYGYPLMFAAYNAGPQQIGDALSRGRSFPAETLNYLGALSRRLDPNGHWFAHPENVEDANLTEEGKKAALLASQPAKSVDAQSGSYLSTLPSSTLNQDGLKAAELAALPQPQ
jgi:soluble lytic murein transglycosylase-like protein